MAKKKVIVQIPVLIRKQKDDVFGAWCPHFNKQFTLVTAEEDKIGLESNSGIRHVEHLTLSTLQAEIYRLLCKSYTRKGYVEQPDSVDNDSMSKLGADDYWISFNYTFEVKTKCCELTLPKIALASAVLTQGLLLLSASVSIYVKGLSAPMIIIFATSTGISTLINFTQSGTSESVARLGRYLDNKPLRRCSLDCEQLNHKSLYLVSGSVIFVVWTMTLVGNSISALSETEIIDRAGYNVGLTFLTDNFITFHAVSLTILGGITAGTFGGNFAYRALTSFCSWVISRCCRQSEDIEQEDENSELLPLLGNN